MARSVIMVMDSVGIGGAADAEAYGDAGADTLGHIAEACAAGTADSDARSGPLRLPNLARLGLGLAARASTGRIPPGLEADEGAIEGAYGFAAEQSRGKDTPSGHWEIAGLPVAFDWGLFPDTVPCFPEGLVADFVAKAGLPGILGDKHASGTEIVAELGGEHVETCKPICYTSADSVFQIACHEESFGLERLYEICETAKRLTDALNIGRVIARPFKGDEASGFTRTANRRDYTTPPHGDTLLDRVTAHGGEVVAIGKIADIFAHRGVARAVKASGNMALLDATLEALGTAPDGALVFANLVDFDSEYGHRRNVAGYAAALEALDARIPELTGALSDGDLLLITADHGCDPTWKGTDHTRENVPVLFRGPGVKMADLGRRDSFADMGQTVAAHLGTPALDFGTPCF